MWALNEILLLYHQPLLNGDTCTLISCYYDLGFSELCFGVKGQFISPVQPFVALVGVLGTECGERRGRRENVDLKSANLVSDNSTVLHIFSLAALERGTTRVDLPAWVHSVHTGGAKPPTPSSTTTTFGQEQRNDDHAGRGPKQGGGGTEDQGNGDDGGNGPVVEHTSALPVLSQVIPGDGGAAGELTTLLLVNLTVRTLESEEAVCWLEGASSNFHMYTHTHTHPCVHTTQLCP